MTQFGLLDESTLRLFAETTGEGVWVTDQDGKILFGNHKIAAMTGHSADAFRGRTIFDFIAEGCRSRAESLIEDTRTNRPDGVKLSLKTGHGSTLSVSVNSAPFHDQDDRLAGFLFILTNVQVEQALRENSARIRELYENMPLGYQSLDAEGRFLDVNQTWLDLFGYQREDVIGKSFADFLPPDQRELFQKRFAQFKQLGEVKGVEFEFLHRDGSYHVITCDGRIGYDHKMDFDRTHCIVKDITARVRAEQALQETNARMSTVLSTIPAFVFMKNRDLEYISANQAFCDQAKVPLDQIEGKSDYDLFSAEEARKYRQNDLFILETGQPLINQLETLTDKSGKTQWVLTNKRPVYNQDGEIISIVGISMDITERKQIESQLKERENDYQRLVRHLQKAREKERSIIAREIHDGVGQALTALKFDLDWLEKRINADQVALAEKIAGTTALVDETIDLVRSVSASLRPGMLDDLGLVDALEWQLEGLARRTGLDCQLCANGDRFDLPSALETDLFRIAQEALTNIARHAQAEHVILDLNVSPDNVEMTIQDDGRGIKAEEISKADSFGLLSMRERVRNWGGKIWIEGDEQAGTTITVRIVRSIHGEEA